MNSLYQADFTHLSTIHEDVKENSGIKMPIAIYSHCLYGWRQFSTSTCENLACYGFFVIACDHSPDATISRPIAQRDCFRPFDYFGPKPCTDDEERHFYRGGVNRRVNDIQQLLDYITSSALQKQYPQLTDRLNVERICMWGHSYGGTTVTSLSSIDPRPSKVIALDAWMFPMPDHMRQTGIQHASLLSLNTQYWPLAKVSRIWICIICV